MFYWNRKHPDNASEPTPRCPVCHGTPIKNMLMLPGSDFWYCKDCKIDVEHYRKQLAEGTAKPIVRKSSDTFEYGGYQNYNPMIYIGDD